ncbi:hypothetical protein [Nocardia huaxiensis]|uniref:Uncharacterized protein n=1 Tax=Nocardia huaxiensis TaxID=2755382 RepID=A0A7D6Z7L2_9NOCA|nr:hypothetical protein [Nocardia huaxiensis]QLY33724.1 hypothetical protein H0264_17125 [Nocardia huaxiensis]UFS99353.1 hypothetical protein LPY97_16395 [Nocardia huaxiensis]
MNPCPRCGLLDQARTIRAILQNDVRYSSSVSELHLGGTTSFDLKGKSSGSVRSSGSLLPGAFTSGTSTMRGSSSTHMSGSMSQQGVESTGLAETLGDVEFLDRRYAYLTRHPLSTPLTVGTWALTALCLLLGLLVADGFFGFVLGALCFPAVVGGIGVPLSRRIADHLDEEATASDQSKIEARGRAGLRVQVWETLVYCGRDHAVYNPRSGDWFAPEHTTDYLFRIIPEPSLSPIQPGGYPPSHY